MEVNTLRMWCVVGPLFYMLLHDMTEGFESLLVAPCQGGVEEAYFKSLCISYVILLEISRFILIGRLQSVLMLHID